MTVTRLYPNAPGINFGSDYTLIDDVTPDGDASYVVIAKGAAELFDLTDLSLPAGAFIESVTIGLCAASETNGHQVTYRAILASGGSSWGNVDGSLSPLYAVTNSSIYDTSSFPFTSFGGGTAPLTLSPFTGVAWTEGEINGMMAGWDVESDPSPYVRPRITQLYVDVAWFVPNLFLFGSSSSAGHTNVFGRDTGSASWFLLPAANPDALWFESLSTDYASMLPDGYAQPGDGNLYSFVPHFDTSPGDYTMTRFNRTTRIIEAALDLDSGSDPGIYVRSNAYWERDSSDGAGKSVAWSIPNSPNIFYWDGIAATYNSPHDDNWVWDAESAADFTSFPQTITHITHAAVAPYIHAVGGYLFKMGGYYYLYTYIAMFPDNGIIPATLTTWFGNGLLRFQDVGTPPDSYSRIGTDSLRAIMAPITPDPDDSSQGETSQFFEPLPPVRWNGHVWLPALLPSHVLAADGTTVLTSVNQHCLYLLASSGDVKPALDLPTSGTYQAGAEVFVHKETNTVFAWAFDGTAFNSVNRLLLYRLDTFDVAAGTFSWTAFDPLEVTGDAFSIRGAVGDEGSLYFCYGPTTDQVVYRFDIAGEAWVTESILDLTGDEFLVMLVKIAPLSTGRRPQFGAVIG